MQWSERAMGLWRWRRQRASAWGAVLDQQDILLVALSLQQTGHVRVQVYEHLHAPEGLVHPLERDHWLGQTLHGLGTQLPAHLRSMGLALGESRCREGVIDWSGPHDMRRLQAEVQLEAAAAWQVPPDAVGFDFRAQACEDGMALRLHWVACLHQELTQWRQQARAAGWRLPLVEPEFQAAQRAAQCLRGKEQPDWAESPQDWQFERTAQRALDDVDWARLRAAPMWKRLVACGAALGVLQ